MLPFFSPLSAVAAGLLLKAWRDSMLKPMSLIFAMALAAAVAGCATTPTVTSQTVIVAGVGPVEVEQLNVEIVDVDPAARMVLVRQGGHTWNVAVPEVFGNLQNI